jgi:ribosome-binding protein aMBF1 (putative translation factor)
MDLTPMVLRKYNNKLHPKQPIKQNFIEEPKTDDSIYNMTIKYIKPELSKQFTQARIDKGLTRKELAQYLSIKESVVIEIEDGSAKHNGPLISKFKKFLGLDNKY